MAYLKLIFLFSLSLSCNFAFAESKVEMINDMVPKGWILVYYSLGDINQDGKDDAIMVIENTSRAYLKRNRIVGPRVLNINPRKMMVLFQTATGYKEVLRVGNGFPTEHNAEKPCLADPLVETGEIKINHGEIKVALNYRSMCSNFDSVEHTFEFRYQGTRFHLVEFNEMKFNRISGDATQYNIDYVVGQKMTITGINIYEKSKQRTLVQNIQVSNRLYLDEISLACTPNNQSECRKKINQAHSVATDY